MDGTLTPAREKMNWDMVSVLTKLQQQDWDVGVISGSDLDYIEQQCDKLLDISPFNARECHMLPCNGTKYYKNLKKIWEYNIKDVIDQSQINKLIKCIFKQQLKIIKNYNIPLTGNFIEQRGSIINWCPIGRKANHVERKIWCKLDEKNNIRIKSLEKLKKITKEMNITVKLGGETSFDIYPVGWNKTFPLDKQPFSTYEQIYFIGDRCFKNGNDKEIYDYLNNKKNCKSFNTKNPLDTISILKKHILKG